MKTRNLILTAALLVTGSWAGDLLAQANLNALMKKCESKTDGKVMPSFYRFAVGTSDISFSLDDLDKKFKGNEYLLRNGEIQVTKIERFDFKEESEWG